MTLDNIRKSKTNFSLLSATMMHSVMQAMQLNTCHIILCSSVSGIEHPYAWGMDLLKVAMATDVWRAASLKISFNQLESDWETIAHKFIIYARMKIS